MCTLLASASRLLSAALLDTAPHAAVPCGHTWAAVLGACSATTVRRLAGLPETDQHREISWWHPVVDRHWMAWWTSNTKAPEGGIAERDAYERVVGVTFLVESALRRVALWCSRADFTRQRRRNSAPHSCLLSHILQEDLVHPAELAEGLRGHWAAAVAEVHRVFVNPHGLNVRNLVMHGFLCPQSMLFESDVMPPPRPTVGGDSTSAFLQSVGDVLVALLDAVASLAHMLPRSAAAVGAGDDDAYCLLLPLLKLDDDSPTAQAIRFAKEAIFLSSNEVPLTTQSATQHCVGWMTDFTRLECLVRLRWAVARHSVNAAGLRGDGDTDVPLASFLPPRDSAFLDLATLCDDLNRWGALHRGIAAALALTWDTWCALLCDLDGPKLRDTLFHAKWNPLETTNLSELRWCLVARSSLATLVEGLRVVAPRMASCVGERLLVRRCSDSQDLSRASRRHDAQLGAALWPLAPQRWFRHCTMGILELRRWYEMTEIEGSDDWCVDAASAVLLDEHGFTTHGSALSLAELRSALLGAASAVMQGMADVLDLEGLPQCCRSHANSAGQPSGVCAQARAVLAAAEYLWCAVQQRRLELVGLVHCRLARERQRQALVRLRLALPLLRDLIAACLGRAFSLAVTRSASADVWRHLHCSLVQLSSCLRTQNAASLHKPLWIMWRMFRDTQDGYGN